MAGITRFEEIKAWITARQLTNMIYALSNQTGFSRDFGLRDQILRASVSVEQFNESAITVEKCSRQISKFITYLETNPRQRRVSNNDASYMVDLPPDL